MSKDAGLKIVVTSTNPVKMNATHMAFKALFPIIPFHIKELAVKTDISEQPLSENETLLGAINRVNNAKKIIPDADYWIGIEGGIEMKNNEIECFAWIYVQSKNGKTGKGRTGTFFLPQKIVDLILAGKELGEADDIVFNRVNSKQKTGTIGALTGDVIGRTEYYKDAIIFAFLPFKNPDLYP